MNAWCWVAIVVGGIFLFVLCLALVDWVVAHLDRRRDVRFSAELERIAREHKARMRGER